MTESRESYIVSETEPEPLQRQLTFFFERMAQRFDTIEGHRPPTAGLFFNDGNGAVFSKDGDALEVENMTITDLTASRIVASDADKKLESIDLDDWVAGTTNQVNVADDTDGTITLSTPQDIHTGATPTFAGFVQVGDATNKMTVAADGEIGLEGTARVEQFIENLTITGRGASAPTARTTEAPYLSWTFAVNDDTHQSFEAPYEMDYTNDSWIKLHWYTDVSQITDEVQWQASWNAKAESGGEAVNAGATTDVSGDVNCPAQWMIQETLVETIPGGSIAVGDIIGLDITRIAIDDGTNPQVGTIHLLSIEYEFYVNKLGKAT